MKALDDIAGVVGAYVAVTKQINDATKLQKKLRAEIDAAIGDSDGATIGGKTALTYSTSKGSRFDGKALKEDYPDIYAAYEIPTETRRLLIPKEEA